MRPLLAFLATVSPEFAQRAFRAAQSSIMDPLERDSYLCFQDFPTDAAPSRSPPYLNPLQSAKISRQPGIVANFPHLSWNASPLTRKHWISFTYLIWRASFCAHQIIRARRILELVRQYRSDDP